jgi:hypothetical protein
MDVVGHHRLGRPRRPIVALAPGLPGPIDPLGAFGLSAIRTLAAPRLTRVRTLAAPRLTRVRTLAAPRLTRVRTLAAPRLRPTGLLRL